MLNRVPRDLWLALFVVLFVVLWETEIHRATIALLAGAIALTYGVVALQRGHSISRREAPRTAEQPAVTLAIRDKLEDLGSLPAHVVRPCPYCRYQDCMSNFAGYRSEDYRNVMVVSCPRCQKSLRFDLHRQTLRKPSHLLEFLAGVVRTLFSDPEW